MALVVKNPSTNAGDVRDTGLLHPLEKDMATYSGILAWKISWTEKPGRLQPCDCIEPDMTEVTEHEHQLVR